MRSATAEPRAARRQPGGLVVMARVTTTSGRPTTVVDVTHVRYRLRRIPTGDERCADRRGDDWRLLVSTRVLSDELQCDPGWTVDRYGYNFRHAIELEPEEPGGANRARFVAEYELTAVNGRTLTIRFHFGRSTR